MKYISQKDALSDENIIEVNTKEYGTIEVVPVGILEGLPTIDPQEIQGRQYKAGDLMKEVLNGIKTGKDEHSVLMDAVKAISILTDNKIFLKQCAEYAYISYGLGDLKPTPLEEEILKIQERLDRLEISYENETRFEIREVIKRAIKAHENKIKELNEKIKQSNKKIDKDMPVCLK